MKKFFKKLDKFETHHRVVVFCLVLIGTVMVTRFLVLFYNPNPVLFGVELHHFDYGLFLLLISSGLMLFEPRKYINVNLFFTAIASGLILDEYWLVRKSVVEDTTNSIELYYSSLPTAVIIGTVTILVILFFNSILKRS